MADRGKSQRFDRINRPNAERSHTRDQSGKEALYSTSPGAAPTSPVLVICRRCDVEKGLGLLESLKLLRPPMFVNPATGRMWAKCPTCHRRSWLHVRTGQALRAFTDRPER
ncbi:MAG: hypothetical protein R3320_04120 [Nitriliruptorales bacterium]|nr:hypothetical protein [Nitriliruptorales bacterium]